MYPHNPYFGIAPQYYGFVGITPMAMPPPAIAPVPAVLPPVAVPSITPVSEASTASGEPNNLTAFKYVRDKPPVTTVFVGNIVESAPDQLIKALLMRCGNILSWKRVQGASGKLQAFGFCEYEDPESTMRCVRLLNGFQVGPKTLLVKVDPKTESLLDEYKKKKEQSGEKGTLGATADEVDSSTLRDDETVKSALENIIKENAAVLDGDAPKKDLYLEGPRHLTIEDMDLDNDRKDLINREIEIFRKRHEKEDDDDTAPRRTKPYDRDRPNTGFASYSAFAESERRDRRDKTRRSRSRSSSLERARRLRGAITSSALAPSGKPLVIDDEEEAIRKKLERKLREKEESYQKRLKQWEAREKKKRNEYEHEKEHERKRQRELQTEAQRLQEFFEDYDDNIEDPKYYRGSALHQRLKDREIEEAADERDRQKEIEQLETARRKLIEDGDPNAESIILQMEQKMQEHLRRRLNVNGELLPSADDTVEDNDVDQEESPREEQKFIAINQVESDYKDTEDASPSSDHDINHKKQLVPESETNGMDETNGGLRKDGSSTFLFAMSAAEPVVRKTAAAFAEEESDDRPKKRTPAFLPPSAFKSASGNTPGVQDTVSNNDQSSLPPASALSTEEKKAIIKRIIEGIPTSKSELFAYPIDWDIVDSDFINSRIKPWVDKKIVSYIGEAEATLSNFICERLLHHNPPERILRDIAMVLDEEAEVFVVKMWRLLIYVISEKKAGLSA